MLIFPGVTFFKNTQRSSHPSIWRHLLWFQPTLREGDHGSQIASCETLRRDQGWDGFSDFPRGGWKLAVEKNVFFFPIQRSFVEESKKVKTFFFGERISRTHIFIWFVYRLSFLLLNSQHFCLSWVIDDRGNEVHRWITIFWKHHRQNSKQERGPS